MRNFIIRNILIVLVMIFAAMLIGKIGGMTIMLLAVLGIIVKGVEVLLSDLFN